MIVEAGVWSYGNASASAVTDSAGNTYTELTHFKASDNTELSVWSAPITAGGGRRATITVTASGKADIGAAVLGYSGLSDAAGTAAVDQIGRHGAHRLGRQQERRPDGPHRGPRAGELAVGFYAALPQNRGLDPRRGDPVRDGAWAGRVGELPISRPAPRSQRHLRRAERDQHRKRGAQDEEGGR